MKKVSIIIPTYNRLECLKKAVHATLYQSVDPEDYEVIVIDDGSNDGTKEYLNEVKGIHNNFHFRSQQNGGPASARNLGLNISIAPIIAFTDDDCIVGNHWIETILKAFEDSELAAVQGSTYSDASIITPFTHQVENEEGNNTIPTCNAAYRKVRINEIGGFDTQFPFPHNEDADLAWRTSERFKVAFNAEMRVYHPPREERFEKIAKRMRMLVSEFSLYHKNPVVYQKYRAVSPWMTIYAIVFLNHIPRNFLRLRKYFFTPSLFLKGVALHIIWWAHLVILLPKFLWADVHFKTVYQSR